MGELILTSLVGDSRNFSGSIVATTGGRKNWRGKAGTAPNKSPKSKAVGPVLFLVALLLVVVWLLIPRPPTPVHLLVVSGSPDVRANVLDAAAEADTHAVHSVFTKVAEQSESYHSHDRLTPAQAESLTEKTDLENGILVFFLHARQVVSLDGDLPELELQFPSTPKPLSLEKFLREIAALKPERAVVLMEISHEFPSMFSQSATNAALQLLEQKHQQLLEEFPNLDLTIITSAAPYETSLPFQVADADSTDALPCPRYHGTAFGQAVATAFRNGEIDRIDSLFESLKKAVDGHAQNFGRQQTVTLLGKPIEGEGPNLFVKTQVVPEESSAEGDKAEETETPPSKTGEEPPAEEKLSTLDRLAQTEQKVQQLLSGVDGVSLTFEEWLRIDGLLRDALYLLLNQHDTTEIDYQELAGRYIDNVETMVEQVRNSKSDATDFDLLNWVPPVNFTSLEPDGAFRDLLAQVIDEETDRKLIEQYSDDESRKKLVASFLGYWEGLKDFGNSPSPEDLMLLHKEQAELKQFFSRLSLETGWRRPEWPHQFVLLDEVLEKTEPEWSASQFKAVHEILWLRSQLMQLAIGYRLDGKTALDQAEHSRIAKQVTESLNRLTSAERWLFLGEQGFPLVQSNLDDARDIEIEVVNSLEDSSDESSNKAKQRVALFTLGSAIGSRLDRIAHEAENFKPFQGVSNLDDLTKYLIEDVTNRKVSWEPAEQFLDLVHLDSSDDSLSRVSSDYFRNLERFHTCLPDELRVKDRYIHIGGSRGIFHGYSAVQCLHSLNPDSPQVKNLKASWLQLCQSHGSQEGVLIKQMQFEKDLIAARNATANHSLTPFNGPSDDAVAEVILGDLIQRAQIASEEYDKIRILTAEQYSPLQSWELGTDYILNDDLEATIEVNLPTDEQLYVFSQDTILEGGEITPVSGWSKMKPGTTELKLRADRSRFSGLSTPILARVGEEGVVKEFRTIQVRQGFISNGWRVDVSVAGQQLNFTDIKYRKPGSEAPADELPIHRYIDLPANTLDAKTIDVVLVRPAGAYDKTVTSMLYSLDKMGNLADEVWVSPIQLSFADGTGQAAIPLIPPPAEGELDPTLKVDLTNGFALKIQPSQTDSTNAQQDVVLKVFPRYINPIDFADGQSSGYVNVGRPSYDAVSHQLAIPIDRKATVEDVLFPPKKVTANLNLSRGLKAYLAIEDLPPANVLPQRQRMVAPFRADVEEFIEKVARRSDGRLEDLEFSLGVAGLDHLARWRLSPLGPPRRLGINANEPAIRTTLDVNVPEGLQRVDLDGQPVVVSAETAEQKQATEFQLEVHTFGWPRYGSDVNLTDRDATAELRINFAGQSGESNSNVMKISMRDSYKRTVSASPSNTGQWIVSTLSENHRPDFPVTLSSFSRGEGRYELATLLRDASQADPIAESLSLFTIENSGPEIKAWDKDIPSVDVGRAFTRTITVTDPQTGIESVSILIAPETVIEAKLSSSPQSQFGQFEATFTIPAKNLGTIEIGTQPKSEDRKIEIVAVNRVGMETKVSQTIELVQRKVKALPLDTSPKFRDLVVESSQNGEFSVTLSGPNGEEIGTKKGKKALVFSDLKEGKYQVNWVISYNGKSGSKDVALDVPSKNEKAKKVTVP